MADSTSLPDETRIIQELQDWIDHEDWEPKVEDRDRSLCWKLLEDPELQPIPDELETHGEPNPQIPNPASAPTRHDRYRPIEHLGAGGFGIVIHAHDSHLRRDIAIKMVRPSLGGQPRLLHRFLREARAMASLQHPGIVQVFECGVLGKTHYIASEWVDGPSLAAILKAGGQPLPPRQCASILHHVASAVYFAHSRGILHRDLKPGNILLAKGTPDDCEGFGYRPRLTDFGLAKTFERASDASEDLSIDTRTLGTLRYMSPEQASGHLKHVTITSDVFSLGIILYQLLTGRMPFDGETDYEVAVKICQADPVRPRKLNPKIPKELEAIALKCLAKLPEERYGSADLLASDLERHLKGLPVTAGNASTLSSIAYWRKTHPLQAIAVGVMLGSILFAAITSGTFWWRERQANQRVRRELIQLQGIVFPLAEKINDGVQITQQEELSILSELLEFTKQYVRDDPSDNQSLHRLSVLHHYNANALSQLNRMKEAEENRRACLEILDRLIVVDPRNRKKYRYQVFMAHFLYAMGIYQHPEGADRSRFDAAYDAATETITQLVEEYPEDVDFADAFNAVRIQSITFRPCPRAETNLMLEEMIASSRQLVLSHPDRPGLAKHAIEGYLTQVEYAKQDGDLEKQFSLIEDAKALFERAYRDVHGLLETKLMRLRLANCSVTAALEKNSLASAIDEGKVVATIGLSTHDDSMHAKLIRTQCIEVLDRIREACVQNGLDSEVLRLEVEIAALKEVAGDSGNGNQN